MTGKPLISLHNLFTTSNMMSTHWMNMIYKVYPLRKGFCIQRMDLCVCIYARYYLMQKQRQWFSELIYFEADITLQNSLKFKIYLFLHHGYWVKRGYSCWKLYGFTKSFENFTIRNFCPYYSAIIMKWASFVLFCYPAQEAVFGKYYRRYTIRG